MQLLKLKEASIKAAIVLVPTYSMAYFTEKMVWVVPTLAAAGFFAGTISITDTDTTRRLEDEVDLDIDQSVDSGTMADEDADG